MMVSKCFLLLACLAALVAGAAGFKSDLALMPNGASYGITLGHPGGNARSTNSLANSLRAAGRKWTQALCQADSDGDGQSNGLEMGDPCCVWTTGDTPRFTTGLSNPNSATDTTANAMPNCATAAVRPLRTVSRPFVVSAAMPCAACRAEFAALDADDAAQICNQIIKCVQAPTAAPVVQSAPRQLPCSQCHADLAQAGMSVGDASKICADVLQCSLHSADTSMKPMPFNVANAAAASADGQLNCFCNSYSYPVDSCDKCICEESYGHMGSFCL